MLNLLSRNPNKVPSPSREDMVTMINKAWKDIEIDYAMIFKSLFITNKLDGSEDYMVSDKIITLIGHNIGRNY